MGGIGDFFSSVFDGLTGNGGSENTGDATVTQTPWAGLQPYIMAALKQAASLYNTGGPQYYPDSTVVPFSPQTQLAMEMMQNRATQGSPYQNAAGNFVLNQLGGANQNPALDHLKKFSDARVAADVINAPVSSAGLSSTAPKSAAGLAGPAAMADAARSGRAPVIGASTSGRAPVISAEQSGRTPMMNAASIGRNMRVDEGPGITGLTRSTLNQTMRGDFLNSNPYLDKTFEQASRGVTRQWNESVMPGVNATFSLAGRTGANVHQNAMNQASAELGTTLSDLGNNIYGTNYQNERGRMLQAADSLGGMDLAEQGNRLAASQANAANNLTRNINQANLVQSANQFNTGNRLQNQQFNTGLRQATNVFNAGNQLQNQQFNAGQRQAANVFNAGNQLQNQQFNAGNQQQANLFNAGNQQQTSLFNAGQRQNNNQFNAGNQLQNQQFNAGQMQNNNQFNANLNQAAQFQNAANNLNAQQFNQNYGLDIGQLMNQMYQAGFANDLAASNLGMGLANQDYYDINQLMGVGGKVEDQAGKVLQDQINRFNYYQQAPERNFNQLVQWLGAIPGSGFTTAHQDTDMNQGSAFGDLLGSFISDKYGKKIGLGG